MTSTTPEQQAAPVRVVMNRQQLEALRQELGLRFDWHEPDERGVSFELKHGELDNAMCSPESGEAGVWITKDGRRVAFVNLALLLAFATGGYEGIPGTGRGW